MTRSDDPRIRRWQRINLGLYILAPLANFGSQWIAPMEARGTTDARTLVDAAGYAFSIWAVIFLGMLWHSWRQLQRPAAPDPSLRQATYGLAVAGVAAIVFVPITFWDIPWTGLLTVLTLLAGVAMGYRHLRRWTRQEWAYYHWPVGIFLGWMMVATVVSAAQTLAEAGWQPGATVSLGLAIGLYAVVVLLGLGFALRRSDFLVPLTLAWGLLAIGIRQQDYVLSAAALVGALLLLLLAGWAAFQPDRGVWVGGPRRP